MQLENHSPILYLHEYRHIPDEIVRWKNDENLKPWKPDLFTASDFPEYKFREPETDRSQSEELSGGIPERLCVGIGTYKTTKDGEIYLCILIDPEDRTVKSYSIGVYRSEELVEKALGNLFAVYGEPDKPLILRSSQNSLYQRKQYRELLEAYPVRAEMTEKGTRGGVMAVSTFYSQLMRRKGSYEFRDWQAAVDWLSNYIYRYNAKKGFFCQQQND